MGVGGRLRVPRIGPTFPTSSTKFRGLAGFYWRSKRNVGCRRDLEPARRLWCDLWRWYRPIRVDEYPIYGGWVVRWGWFWAFGIFVHNHHSTWTWRIFWAAVWWVGFVRLVWEESGKWTWGGLWDVVLIWCGGASHFNDRVALFKVSLYVALGQHESKEFAIVDTENAFVGVQEEVVLP